MFKERIVKFSDGTYGIQTRSGWFRKPKFLELGSSYSYSLDQSSAKYCKSRDLEKVKVCYDARNCTFAPLKTDLSAHM